MVHGVFMCFYQKFGSECFSCRQDDFPALMAYAICVSIFIYEDQDEEKETCWD
jgi:hypothetical protein